MILAFLKTYRPRFIYTVHLVTGAGEVQRVCLLGVLVGSIKGPFWSSVGSTVIDEPCLQWARIVFGLVHKE